ncbi:hypothetical protein P186_0211 [Pyrobaculum ferrireducens]|uniref:Uncharacterized protein n=1 Tax=Pyrobaculum ferrireducens TaxID=1104324 RepID=G7VF56_9CREN|nr:hypothetical protein P186_0211 [Pyrobaculum ferrireducens]
MKWRIDTERYKRDRLREALRDAEVLGGPRGWVTRLDCP